MSLRVVHVASGREWRGGQRQVWLGARALSRVPGIEQVVITGEGTELAQRLARDAVPVRLARWTLGLDPRALFAVLSESRASDILHAHDSHALTLAALVAQLRGCRIVATRRTEFPLGGRGFWHRADRVVAISDAVHQKLVAGGVPAERVSLIPSGIDVDGLQKRERIDPRAALGLGPDTQVAITVGALDRHKGQNTVVAAAAAARGRLPNLHWILVGEGRQRPALEAQIAQLGVAGTVHLLGHIHDPEALIGGSDVLVATPVAEALGTAILDAMALGVPVVATKTGGIPESLAGGAGLLVGAGSPREVADAVVRILTSTQERARMVRVAAERVRSYTDARMAEALASLYRSMQKEIGD